MRLAGCWTWAKEAKSERGRRWEMNRDQPNRWSRATSRAINLPNSSGIDGAAGTEEGVDRFVGVASATVGAGLFFERRVRVALDGARLAAEGGVRQLEVQLRGFATTFFNLSLCWLTLACE